MENSAIKRISEHLLTLRNRGVSKLIVLKIIVIHTHN